MNASEYLNTEMSRRALIKGATAAGLALAAGMPNASAAPAKSSVIQRENAKPGTKDWMLTNVWIDPDTWWRSPRIEG